MAHDHDHDHEHSELSPTQLRVRALETILTEKGYVDPAALDILIETYEKKVGPRNGARVVAKAWSDPEYRNWLLKDANPAVASAGYAGREGEHMVVLENTPARHNMVVCTLCSCYPWPVLGLPPVWYKSAPYRSRAVIDPRGILREVGTEPPGALRGRGPVRYEKNAPVFHERWEGRVFALDRSTRALRKWNLDAWRHTIELLPPVDYLRMSYYERWLVTLETRGVKYGLVTQEEMETGKAAPGSTRATPALTLETSSRWLNRGIASSQDPGVPPLFAVGQRA